MSTITGEYSLSQLLPYAPATMKNGDLSKKGLNEYLLLLHVTKLAVEAWQNRAFEKFDPLVKENACQIRAVKIAMIASRFIWRGDLVHSKIEKVEKLKLDTKTLQMLMLKGVTLQDIIVQNGDVTFGADGLFLLQSFILTAVKEQRESLALRGIDEESNPKRLTEFGVSFSFAKKLVDKLRFDLATASVAFVQSQAAALGEGELMKMSSDDFTILCPHSGPSIPIFWSYKTLLLSAREAQIPLVIVVSFKIEEQNYRSVGKESVFFRSSGKGYFAVEPNAEELKAVSVIIEGVSCAPTEETLLPREAWKERFLSFSIEAVTLAGAADHRQYPLNKEGDNRVETLPAEEREEFEYYKSLAVKEGFTEANSTTFLIQHVYAAVTQKLYRGVSP